MIKNDIQLDNDWKKLDRLIDKLLFVRESRFAMRNIISDLNSENGSLHYRYSGVTIDNVDQFFADDANGLIINYVNGEDE